MRESKHRQRQGQTVRNRKRGQQRHHLSQASQRTFGGRARTEQQRRKQHHDEQHVVGPREQMLYPALEELAHQCELAARSVEVGDRFGGRGDTGVRHAVDGDIEQSAVVRIDLEQRAVSDIETCDRDRTTQRRPQHRVTAVT